MKKENPFDHKRVEKVLFPMYMPIAPDKRRTRRFLRKMSRYAERAFEIGYRDGTEGKPMIPWEPSQIPAESQLAIDMCHRAHVAYSSGYRAGARVRREE